MKWKEDGKKTLSTVSLQIKIAESFAWWNERIEEKWPKTSVRPFDWVKQLLIFSFSSIYMLLCYYNVVLYVVINLFSPLHTYKIFNSFYADKHTYFICLSFLSKRKMRKKVYFLPTSCYSSLLKVFNWIPFIIYDVL